MSKINASQKACVTHSMLSPVKNGENELGTGWLSRVSLHLWKGALRALS